MTRTTKLRRRVGASTESGLTLVEISVAIVVASALLLASAGAFSSSLSAVSQAERTQTGALFLETTMEDVSAQPYENLLALHGNRVFSNTNADDSAHIVELSVFQAQVGLLQLSASLIDTRTDLEIGRVTMLRSTR